MTETLLTSKSAKHSLIKQIRTRFCRPLSTWRQPIVPFCHAMMPSFQAFAVSTNSPTKLHRSSLRTSPLLLGFFLHHGVFLLLSSIPSYAHYSLSQTESTESTPYQHCKTTFYGVKRTPQSSPTRAKSLKKTICQRRVVKWTPEFNVRHRQWSIRPPLQCFV